MSNLVWTIVFISGLNPRKSMWSYCLSGVIKCLMTSSPMSRSWRKLEPNMLVTSPLYILNQLKHIWRVCTKTSSWYQQIKLATISLLFVRSFTSRNQCKNWKFTKTPYQVRKDDNTYVRADKNPQDIIKRHKRYVKSNLNIDKVTEKLPFLYWIPKMHKNPT